MSRPAARPEPAPTRARDDPRPPAPVLTGIARVDRHLAASNAGGRAVYLHEPGLDAAGFLQHALQAWMDRGGTAVYATTSRAPAAILEDHERLGYSAPAFRSRAFVVDLREAADVAAAERALRQRLEAHAGAGLLIESLTGLVHAFGEGPVRDWWPTFRSSIPDRACLVQLSDRGFDEATRAALLEGEAVLRLLRRELNGVRLDLLRHDAASSSVALPYRVERPGGVQIHLPKVLVTGPHNAGKTSLVHTLSGAGVSVERLGTTVSLDHGHVDREGVSIDVFGTPGQERFEPIIQQVAHGALGVIVVVDATRPSTFHRAAQLARETAGEGLPVVFAANKQDAPGAASPEELRRALRAPDSVPVVACVAGDRAKAEAVLDVLIDRVLRWTATA